MMDLKSFSKTILLNSSCNNVLSYKMNTLRTVVHCTMYAVL